MFSPKSKVLVIDGIKVPVDPDFRLMCGFSAAVQSDDSKRLRELAARFYFAGLPEGVSEKAAAQAMTDFYASGFSSRSKSGKGGVMDSAEPVFDFEEDEAYFYADFLSAYGIDLNRAKLHWLDFCALFKGLPDECKLKRIIGIRSERLSDIKSPSEKARVQRLKAAYALKAVPRKRYASAEDRNRAILADIERIHREAMEKRGDK